MKSTNGIVIVYKEKGWTSHDVCNKVRRIFGIKKVGHTGTLDPNASGVMVIASDKDTKALQFLKKDTKEYIDVFYEKLGIEKDEFKSDYYKILLSL